MSRVKHTDDKDQSSKYVFGNFGPSGYMALWAHFGVIWWLRWVLEVRVHEDWWYCVMRIGD